MRGLLGMLGDLGKIKADLEKALEELAGSQFYGGAGGGAVEVTVSGKKELLSVDIDPSALDGNGIENVGELVVAAAKEAFDQAEAERKEKLGAVVEGLPVPPGLLNF